ncbi:MAG: HEAT repeat domain-containing protein [Planctomycetes bacterium]|nr:HEAT repeat domain-containing protein [Planctomycetota bacterium]
MSAGARRRRRVLALAAAGAAATLALAAVYHRPMVSHVVTRLALEDARELAARWSRKIPVDATKAVHGAFDSYGWLFRRDYLDRGYLAATLPASAVTCEALPHWLLLGAFYDARQTELAGQEVWFEEFLAWLDPVLLRSSLREALLEMLTSDWTMLPKPKDQAAGLPKSYLCEWLFGVDDEARTGYYKLWEPRCLAAVQDRHWRAILRDLEHPREKVRAGAVLFLQRHPSRELFAEKARRALEDPSQWVRLAAASTLALRGDASSAAELAGGLEHERWEVRWWCAYTLAGLKRPEDLPALEALEAREPDAWVKDRVAELAKALKRSP